jgi:hypothetical protein
MGRKTRHLKDYRGSLVPAGPARVIALARGERPSRPSTSRAVLEERPIRPAQSRPNLTVVVEEPSARSVDPGLHAALVRDAALARVRELGGPSDLACYTCHCGYVFRAPVSTSVVCPNCQTTQAW